MTTFDEIAELEREIRAKKETLDRLYRERPREPIEGYTFESSRGTKLKLVDLFGDHDDLIFVHNMGKDCPYCTMWADGFNGLLPHLIDRAAFVVCSPDDPAVQRRFATLRGWEFAMVSPVDETFTEDMGFYEDGRYRPGVSTFVREGDSVYRIARRRFGPRDDFCAAWNFFDILQDGVDGWTPRFHYDNEPTTTFSPHIALDVTDRDGEVSMLRDILGMEVVEATTDETILANGSQRFYVQQADDPRVYLEFEVSDLKDIHSDLVEAGCEMHETEIPEGDTSYLVTTPFGTSFHLFERLTKTA